MFAHDQRVKPGPDQQIILVHHREALQKILCVIRLGSSGSDPSWFSSRCWAAALGCSPVLSSAFPQWSQAWAIWWSEQELCKKRGRTQCVTWSGRAPQRAGRFPPKAEGSLEALGHPENTRFLSNLWMCQVQGLWRKSKLCFKGQKTQIERCILFQGRKDSILKYRWTYSLRDLKKFQWKFNRLFFLIEYEKLIWKVD